MRREEDQEDETHVGSSLKAKKKDQSPEMTKGSKMKTHSSFIRNRSLVSRRSGLVNSSTCGSGLSSGRRVGLLSGRSVLSSGSSFIDGL